MSKQRCQWVHNQPDIYIDYHDKEWGVPVYEDRKIFEMLVLESAQAGLSWLTILKRREGYLKAFVNFDYEKVSQFTEQDVEKLIKDEGIIRNRKKIEATINNAKIFMLIQQEFGSFSKYIWGFVGGKPIQNKFKVMSEIPATSTISDILSKDLKKRGMKFIGSTIIYAHMQAMGMVNDHEKTCFRYCEVKSEAST